METETVTPPTSAEIAPAVTAAEAPAAAPIVAEAPAKKPGFIASLVGSADKILKLESSIAEKDQTIAKLTADLATANASISTYAANEAAIEKEAIDFASKKKELEAQAAAIPATVAAKVVETVEALGIEPDALPAANAAPAGPEASGEFSTLKGLEKAAAVFNSQIN